MQADEQVERIFFEVEELCIVDIDDDEDEPTDSDRLGVVLHTIIIDDETDELEYVDMVDDDEVEVLIIVVLENDVIDDEIEDVRVDAMLLIADDDEVEVVLVVLVPEIDEIELLLYAIKQIEVVE